MVWYQTLLGKLLGRKCWVSHPVLLRNLQDLQNYLKITRLWQQYFFELEALADELSNGDRSRFIALLKNIVKKTCLRHHKAKPAEPDVDA
jgi:hypothetical protein